MATYSAGAGTVTGSPKTSGAMARTGVERDAPPMRRTRRTGTPAATSASTPSARPQSIPSTAARATLAGVIASRVRPTSDPVAPGRLGVLSPLRYGSSVSPPAPEAADKASLSRSARSTPSIPAVAVSTRAALSVQTSGRKRPVASAKPATRPLTSAVGLFATAKAVPLVPRETTTSPGRAPRPSAAAMLSPVPGPRIVPVGVSPTIFCGEATSGTAISRPKARISRSVR